MTIVHKNIKKSTEPSRIISPSTPSLLSHNPDVKVKLPKLEITKFDSDIINFQGFYDQFSSAIHSNDTVLTI